MIKSMTNNKALHQIQQPYACNLCSMSFNSKNRLRMHGLSHKIERDFPCDFKGCSKAFKTKWQLQSHKRCHSEGSRFICTFEGCAKSYKTKNNLNDHMQTHKTDEQPFLCLCGKSFKTRRYLNRHKVRSHKGEVTMHPCTFKGCGKLYRSSSSANVHVRTHHGFDQSAECDEPGCGKTLGNSYALQRHKRKVHPKSRDFTCTDCGKSFKTKDNLKMHEFLHKDLRPFQCRFESCRKQFRTRSNCKMHELMHTGERPFQCDCCPKSFRSKVSLNRHREEEDHPSRDDGSATMEFVQDDGNIAGELVLIDGEQDIDEVVQNIGCVVEILDNVEIQN